MIAPPPRTRPRVLALSRRRPVSGSEVGRQGPALGGEALRIEGREIVSGKAEHVDATALALAQ